jgi:hypothetical protein
MLGIAIVVGFGIILTIIVAMSGPSVVQSDINTIAGLAPTPNKKAKKQTSGGVSLYTATLLHTKLTQENRINALVLQNLQNAQRNAPSQPVSSFPPSYRDPATGILM